MTLKSENYIRQKYNTTKYNVIYTNPLKGTQRSILLRLRNLQHVGYLYDIFRTHKNKKNMQKKLDQLSLEIHSVMLISLDICPFWCFFSQKFDSP